MRATRQEKNRQQVGFREETQSDIKLFSPLFINKALNFRRVWFNLRSALELSQKF